MENGKESYRFQYPLRVEYRDLDTNNHVNNATYLSYLESARIAYNVDVLGLASHADRNMVVANTEINYRKPAFYRQMVIVEVRTTWIKRSSYGWEYRMVLDTPERDLIADGRGVSVFIEPENGRGKPMPDTVVAKFEDYEGRNLRLDSAEK